MYRIYLTPEDASVQRRRKKFGGNKGTRFVDGWVEFEDKKIARSVARSLNNCPMGGKKRNYYADDIWNIKFLKGFKWQHLTERLSTLFSLALQNYLGCFMNVFFFAVRWFIFQSSPCPHSPPLADFEKQVREQKIRAEMTEAKRESKFYMDKVGQSKAIKSMANRKRKKGQDTENDDNIRHFKQRKAIEKEELAGGKSGPKAP